MKQTQHYAKLSDARISRDMIALHEKEFSDWRSHFATSNEDRQGLRHAPFCFTEHGILQLSNILKSQQAIKVSFIIIDVFVRLRKSLTEHTELWLAVEKIRNKLDSQDKSMEVIFRYLDDYQKEYLQFQIQS